MLPLMLGAMPTATSAAQRATSDWSCAETLDAANSADELRASARTRRRIRIERAPLWLPPLHPRCRARPPFPQTTNGFDRAQATACPIASGITDRRMIPLDTGALRASRLTIDAHCTVEPPRCKRVHANSISDAGRLGM